MNIASSTLSQIGHFLKGDMLLFVTAFALFLIFALYAGRGRVVALILAYYPATILYSSIPFINKLIVLHTEKLIVLNKIAIFIILLIPITIILNYYLSSYSDHSGASHLIRSGGFALIALSLMFLFSYNLVNYDVFHKFL